MGGFYITNTTDDDVQKKVTDLFNRKGMTTFELIKAGAYKILYFPKILLKVNHVYKHGLDVMIGVGVFFYDNDYGYKALEKIYKDYKEQGNKVFSQVKGHFNFILVADNAVKVVTDKTGTYHSFFAQEKNVWHLSSSMLAIAENLPRLTPQMQEMMEFIHTETIHAGKSVFEEINMLPAGSVVETEKALKSTNYFDATLHEKDYNAEYVANHLIKNICFLKDLNLKISAEFSAGFDSRLVLALLKKAKILHILNTNWNSENFNDSKIAEYIARREKRHIKVILNHATAKDYGRLVDRCVDVMEMSRCSLRAAYSPIFFEEKGRHADLILGGYGGELYRDVKYRNVKNFDDIISRFFNTKNLYESDETCKANLKKKMINLIQLDTKRSGKEMAERIHYFFRLVYWAGSRISAFNQFSYYYHPFTDYTFAYPIFSIRDEEKKNGKFQMQIIERFDSKLARYKSQYGYNFHWYPGKALIIKLTRNIAKYKGKIVYRLKPVKRMYLENNFVRDLKAQHSSLLLSDLKTPEKLVYSRTLARIYTIQNLLRKLKCADQSIKKIVPVSNAN